MSRRQNIELAQQTGRKLLRLLDGLAAWSRSNAPINEGFHRLQTELTFALGEYGEVLIVALPDLTKAAEIELGQVFAFGLLETTAHEATFKIGDRCYSRLTLARGIEFDPNAPTQYCLPPVSDELRDVVRGELDFLICDDLRALDERIQTECDLGLRLLDQTLWSEREYESMSTTATSPATPQPTEGPKANRDEASKAKVGDENVRPKHKQPNEQQKAVKSGADEDEVEAGYLGLRVNERDGNVWRDGFNHGSPVHFKTDAADWHTLLVAYRAGERGATDAEWKKGYGGEWEHRRKRKYDLKHKLSVLGITFETQSLKLVEA